MATNNDLVLVAAERGILSILLKKPSLVGEISKVIEAGHFSTNAYAIVFRCCVQFNEQGREFTWQLVADYLASVGEYKAVFPTPVSFLADIVASFSSEDRLPFFVEVLKERRLRIDLHRKLQELDSQTGDISKPPEDLYRDLRKIEDVFSSASLLRGKTKVLSPENLWSELKGDIIRVAETPFIGTGYDDLDSKLTWGLAPGNVSLIVGRTSSGKSSFRANVIYNLAMRGVYTITISKEQSALAEYFRLIAIHTGKNLQDICRVASWPDKEGMEAAISSTVKMMQSSENGKHLFPHKIVRPRGYYGLADVKREIDATLRENVNPSVIFIDLFDQLDDVQGEFENQASLIKKKVLECADMAESYGIHFCLVCQLKRLGKDRDKLDMREMIQGSGSYEQRADLIMMINRPAYYHPTEIEDNTITVTVLKQRDGPPAICHFGFDKNSLKIFTQTEEVSDEAEGMF
jgi:replicative DNA helicase